MDITSITRIIALAAFVVCLLGIGLRLSVLLSKRKIDHSRPRGSAGRAVLFAFTLGMAPWEKESTRIHWIAYLRGIVFHIGVFMALAVFLVSPWLASLPDLVIWFAAAVTAVGALAGFTGIVMRLMEPNLRTISLPDDYFSIFITGLFVSAACALLLIPSLLPAFYLISAFMFLYIPLSKIRHCAYFFYSKFFFGWNFGHRGTLGQKPGQYAENTADHS